MKKMFFVYNPHSGKGLIRNHLVGILNTFTGAGYLVTAYPTQHARDAYEQVMAVEGQYDMICCSGGDGTLNEVISAIMTYRGEKPVVGYVPAGTTNDFAGSLGIPKDMELAARLIAEEHVFTCDLGQFNGRYFNYVAAFGLFTETSYKTPQNVKNVLGHQAYVLEGIKSLQDVKKYYVKVTSAERQLQGTYIYGMVANSLSIGGYRGITGENVMMDDGLFEVALVREPRNAQEMHEIVSGLLWRQDTSMIERFKTTEVTFESLDPIGWTLDGENGDEHVKSTIKVNPRAIRICAKDPGPDGSSEQ